MRIVLAFAINTLFNFIIGLMVAKFLGPEEYGRFALALAAGIVVQTALFDWVKLAATRFYSERARTEMPALRATLEGTFMLVACLLLAACGLVMLTHLSLFRLQSPLVALALLAAVANGMFDFHAALFRARFMDRDYVRFIIGKHVLGFGLTGGGAYIFHSAEIALLGACISIGGSVFLVRRRLQDPGTGLSAMSKPAAKMALAYSLPIVASNVLYLVAPLFNRGVIASHFGFADTGQFSFAFDMGLRVVAAIGSALDVLLFQIAVAVDEQHGSELGKTQIAKNMVVVFAVVAPACAGIWLVLPSVQAIIVPMQYRGPFAHYLTLVLPGLFCFAMLHYAINPIFQIAKRTAPLIVAAIIASAVDFAIVLLAPQGTDASMIAMAQAAMFIAAFVALVIFALPMQPQWPKPMQIITPTLAVAIMAAALMPMRAWTPGILPLLAQIVTGGLIYGAMVVIFDIAEMRSALLHKLERRRSAKAYAAPTPQGSK